VFQEWEDDKGGFKIKVPSFKVVEFLAVAELKGFSFSGSTTRAA
jgi:hypothetical protein